MPPGRRILFCLFLLSALSAPLLSQTGGGGKPAPKPAGRPDAKRPQTAKRIDVGVVYYKDFEETKQKYQRYLDELAKKLEQSGKRYSFRLAVGTYDDLLEWYKRGDVDAAVMSPGMVAILLNSTDMEEELRNAYVGTLGITPKPGLTYARQERLSEAGDAPYSYYSVGLIPEEAARKLNINTVEELLAYHRARQGPDPSRPAKPGVKFVFVHPLSVSGYLLPKYLLQKKGFAFNPSNYEWTYNHDESLRKMIEERPGGPQDDEPLKVAFVSDETEIKSRSNPATAPDEPAYTREKFRKLVFPELDDAGIPQDLLLLAPPSGGARRDEQRATADEIRGIFRDLGRDGNFNLEQIPNWIDDYKRVAELIQRVDPEQHLATPFSTLDQIVARLVNYDRQSRMQKRGGARLALVLSGGGAKCAYQLGAVEAVEQELDKHRDARGRRKVDVSLVVGTSGGAINALCVALGITGDGPNQNKLRETWKSFKQENFLQPWWQVRLPIGLVLGLLQAILLMRLALVAETLAGRWTDRLSNGWSDRVNFWMATGVLLIVLGVCQFMIDKLNIQLSQLWRVCRLYYENPVEGLWSSLGLFAEQKPKAQGVNHLLLHLWAVLTPTFVYSAAVLVVTGVAMIVGRNHPLQNYIGRVQTRFQRTPVFARVLQAFMALVLSRGALISYLESVALVSLVVMILLPLFTVHSLSDSSGVEKALAKEVPRLLDLKKFQAETEDYAGRLEEVSEHIVRNDLLKRDLVITGSRLPTNAEEIEDERYRTNQSSDPDDMYFFYDRRDDSELFRAPRREAAPGSGAAAGGAGETGLLGEAAGEMAGGGAGEVRGAAHEAVPVDHRFVSFKLKGNSRKLLDVVIGSSSIYPLFQPRRLRNIRLSPGDKGRDVNIIDGGFVHNSPIEAAILWGATHIILIEASPASQPSEQQHLYSNALSAFDYLYTQAQIIDARSRGKIEIFTLRPLPAKPGEDPNSDLLDFSADLIEGAIGKGYNDALNVSEPRFRREPGPPQF